MNLEMLYMPYERFTYNDLLREERRNWQKRMQCVQKVREKERLLALKERVREETEQPPFVE